MSAVSQYYVPFILIAKKYYNPWSKKVSIRSCCLNLVWSLSNMAANVTIQTPAKVWTTTLKIWSVCNNKTCEIQWNAQTSPNLSLPQFAKPSSRPDTSGNMPDTRAIQWGVLNVSVKHCCWALIGIPVARHNPFSPETCSYFSSSTFNSDWTDKNQFDQQGAASLQVHVWGSWFIQLILLP